MVQGSIYYQQLFDDCYTIIKKAELEILLEDFSQLEQENHKMVQTKDNYCWYLFDAKNVTKSRPFIGR